jgi:hypothetical protein
VGDTGETARETAGASKDADDGAGKSGKQVTDHAAEAEVGDADPEQPDISARSTVAADHEEPHEDGDRPAREPRRAGLPRRKPRQW